MKALWIAICATGCTVVGFAAGVLASDSRRMVVVGHDEARFVPVDPNRPDGAQIAILWGDPETGPSSMFMKFAKGEGVMHVHSSDYHLVLLEGSMHHTLPGEDPAKRKVLGPRSFWYQPGDQPHADSCLTDECVMFIQWAGKRDARLAP